MVPMKSKLIEKDKAIVLRGKGYSFREIGEKLSISKSTASFWLRGMILSPKAKKRIEQLGATGREKAKKTIEKKKLFRMKG